MDRRVEQLQPLAAVGNADARLLVGGTRVHYLVVGGKVQDAFFHLDADADVAFRVRRSAILQGILHEGNE